MSRRATLRWRDEMEEAHNRAGMGSARHGLGGIRRVHRGSKLRDQRCHHLPGDCLRQSWWRNGICWRSPAAESSTDRLCLFAARRRRVDRLDGRLSRGQQAALPAVLPPRTGRQYGSHHGAARRWWLHRNRHIGQMLRDVASARRYGPCRPDREALTSPQPAKDERSPPPRQT